jgi:DNA-binding Xre family transcriptional regulator
LNRTADLLETLKRYLKARGMTYRNLADEMQLSEATVKRMFSKKTFTLARLEKVCRLLDIDFHDLALMDRQRRGSAPATLTPEQEAALLADEKLAFLLYFLANGWSVTQILEEYDYTETGMVQRLARLERLALLEVHPHNRVRLKISPNLFTQADGPLRRAYRQPFLDDFLDSSFAAANQHLVFSPGQFSEASLKIIRKKIDNLVKAYHRLAEMDAALPIRGRHSSGLFIAFRPWVFSRIADLHRRRTPGEARFRFRD